MAITPLNRNSKLYREAVYTAMRCLMGQRGPPEIQPLSREETKKVVAARHSGIGPRVVQSAVKAAIVRVALQMLNTGSAPVLVVHRIARQADVTLFVAKQYLQQAKKLLRESALYESEDEARAHIATNLWNVVSDPQSKPSDRVAALRELGNILLTRKAAMVPIESAGVNYITQIVQMIQSEDRLPVATQESIDAYFESLPPPPRSLNGPLPEVVMEDEGEIESLGPIEQPLAFPKSSNGKHRNPLLPPEEPPSDDGDVSDSDLEDLL